MIVIRSLLLALMLAAGSPDPITLSVTPRQAFAPSTVRTTTKIEYNEDNTDACLLYGAEDGEESKDCWSLYGNQRTFTREYKDVSAGNYTFQAIVFNKYGEQHRSVPVTVYLIPRS